MDKKDYISKIEDLTVEQIVEGILAGIVTFEELQQTGNFDKSKQTCVRKLLDKKDDDAFAAATTEAELKAYLSVFPDGKHVSEANKKIKQIQDAIKAEQDAIKAAEDARRERDRMIREIKGNINKYDIDDIITRLDDKTLSDLCEEIGLEVDQIKNYREPRLRESIIPQDESDIPVGYTDIFFWGIPSSGKTCALSAILNTIKKNYSLEAPDCAKKFGATYRDSLINIFPNRSDYGYLPGRTNKETTQYMPFLFYKWGEKNKRKISFFELSGEVFKYFYEVANSTTIIDDYDRDGIENAFKTLDLLLKSNNQKIHFFFIDYNQEMRYETDNNGLTQSDYLDAAATYFRDAKDKNNKPVDIFKKKTDAVYVVVTKSDEIKGNANYRETSARSFLMENFGSFMAVLENQCKKHEVNFKVKLFSIGDVYFKKICKINREYATDIIEDLLERVRPVKNNIFNK
jgi:hypothetical protein